MGAKRFLKTGETAALTVTDPGADWTTDALICSNVDKMSVHVEITSAGDGELYVQVSNDNTNWINLSFEDEEGSILSYITKNAGTAMHKMIFINDVCWSLMRFFWDHTTNGTITLRPVVRNAR
jgi:hypothetical protein